MKTSFALMAAALSLAGCEGIKDHQVVYVWLQPEGFNKAQIAGIKRAFSEWEVALDDYVTFQYVDSKGYPNEIVVRATSVENLRSAHANRVAETKRDPWETGAGGGIYISNDLNHLSNKGDAALFLPITVHEIGHALGLNHVNDKGAIMYPEADRTVRDITCKDIEQFCGNNGCDAKEFHICYGEVM